VGGQINAAGSAITPAVNTYTGQLNVVPTDTATNTAVATAPSTLTPTQQASYNTELGASAAAPNSANTFEASAPYSSLTTNIQNAVQQANLWNAGNNPADISTALSPFEAPGATTGDTTLDSLLISQTPGAYGQIESAVAPAANLQSQLTAGTTAADTALQNAIATDNATTAAAQAAPQTFATNLTSYLDNAVNAAQSANASGNTQLLSDLTNNTPTQADLTALGITPAQWATLSGQLAVDNKPATATYGTNLGTQNTTATPTPVNLSSYLTQTAPAVNAANLATAQDYANVAALQSLLGANAPVEPINSSTVSEAGTAPTLSSDNSFNLAGAETAAQLAPLEAEAQAVENYGNYANQQYGVNHFGGQTASQFNTFIQDLNGELSNLNSQIQKIQSSAQTQSGLNGVNDPSGSGVNAGNVADVVFPIAAPVNEYLINPVESVANDIGRWLGI
jgi:hypothetical protein